MVTNVTEQKRKDAAARDQARALQKRVKELKCLIDISQIVDRDLPMDETLQQIVNLLPEAWQYPAATGARLVVGENEYSTPNYQPSPWMLLCPISIKDQEEGRIEISYRGEEPPNGAAPFLKEERSLLDEVAGRIRRIVEHALAEQAEEDHRAIVDGLKDIAAAISSTLDLDEVLDRILSNIGRVVPHDAATILFIDGDRACVAKSRGFDRWNAQEAVQSMTMNVSQFESLRRMAQTGQPIAIWDISNLGLLPGTLDPVHVQAAVAAPIIADGQTIGFIVLSSATPGFFISTHAERLRAFADQAGVAIRNARLLLHAREREAELELLREAAVELLASSNLQHSLWVLADTAAAWLPLRHVWVHLYDDAQQRLSPGVTRPSDEGSDNAPVPEALATYVAQNRDILVITNPAEHPITAEVVRETGNDCQLISLPLTRGKHVIGVFTAGFEPSTGITDNTLRFLMLLAAQASAAIDTMSLRTETEERSRRLAALNQLTRVGTGTVDLHQLLKNLADETASIIDADHSFITLWDAANQQMIPAAASGALHDLFRQDGIPPGQTTLTQMVLEQGKPIVIQLNRDFPNAPDSLKRFRMRYPAQSILALPLKAGEQNIGALLVTFEHSHEFSPAEIEWVSQAAELVALAIARAQAYAEMEQRVEERTARLRESNQAEREQRTLAEALRDMAAILNSTLDVDDVLNQILANVGRVVPHDSANIMLVENSIASLARARGYEERGALDALLAIYFPANSMFQMRSLIQAGEPVVIPDTHVNPDWKRVPESNYVRSYIGSPIWMDGEVTGFLNLDSATPDFFNLQHVERLQAFANQAAVAIKNARLYDQAKRLAVLEERQRLARDLHDAVSQTLWSASLIADVLPTLWEQDPDEGRRNLEALRELTRTARDEMRALLLELRPGAVSQTALRDLLSQLVKTMGSRTAADIHLSIQGDTALPADVQIATYRIAQEALNNVVKHASATRVEVRVEMAPGYVRMWIEDDGQGFDLAGARAGHLGLGIMRERAEAVGAVFQLTSRAGGGTEISLQWTETH